MILKSYHQRLLYVLLSFVSFYSLGAEPVPFSQLVDKPSDLTCRGLLRLATPQEIFRVGTPTVTVGQSISGARGGKQIQLLRTGPVWWSTFTDNLRNPPGDPRWFIQMMGEEVARFFGFRVVSEEEIWVPDALEFTRAIEALNELLKAQHYTTIPVKFYPSLGVESSEDYLIYLSEDGALPLSQSGNTLIHDISFHLSSILPVQELFTYAQYRAAYTLDLARTIRDEFRATLESKKLIEFIYTSVGLQLDNGLAGFLGFMAIDQAGIAKESLEQRFKNQLQLLHGMPSPVNHILELLSQDYSSWDVRVKYSLLSDAYKGLESVDLSNYRSLVETHAKLYGARFINSEISFNPTGQGFKEEQWLDSILQRHRLIRQVILNSR